ncbi:MAG: beta-mannosidase [Oscillospiraceae bacterium]|nr:beta-mannosidase [Oscillospiraceae bacterium]
MNNLRKLIAFAAAISITASLAGCSEKDGINADTSETTAAQITTASKYEPLKIIYDEIKTDFGTVDLADYPLTSSEVPADYEAVYEAENGEMVGSAAAFEIDGASGGMAVNGVNHGNKDSLVFNVNAEYTGFYDLNFICKSGDDAKRENNIHLDGEEVGKITCTNNGVFGDSYMKNVYLTAGEHKIAIVPSWGYTDYDCLKLTANTSVTADTYKVTAPLSNPNADDHTQRLYKFLCDIYGKYSLTGQYADEGRVSTEFKRIYKQTGGHFAVLGMDMMSYCSGSTAYGSEDVTIQYAYDFYNNGGGIVTLCWHWRSPVEYQVNDEENPWYSSFYKEGSKLDLDKIMNGEDERGHELLMQDIDLISEQLARLRDAGVPVLWRPLHEASGGWFWWGNCKPESYIKLWNTMYDRMTNEHGLTNLIWVWNAQDSDWYPGDETVDIISTDIYADKLVDSSYSGSFAELAEIPTENKLVALSENGCVMDPDKVMETNSRWLYWGTWSEPFTLKQGWLNDEYTSMETLDKAYQSDRTLTLEELPDLKNYPLE